MNHLLKFSTIFFLKPIDPNRCFLYYIYCQVERWKKFKSDKKFLTIKYKVCYNIYIKVFSAGMVEWQTPRTQNPLPSWRKSSNLFIRTEHFDNQV